MLPKNENYFLYGLGNIVKIRRLYLNREFGINDGQSCLAICTRAQYNKNMASENEITDGKRLKIIHSYLDNQCP